MIVRPLIVGLLGSALAAAAAAAAGSTLTSTLGPALGPALGPDLGPDLGRDLRSSPGPPGQVGGARAWARLDATPPGDLLAGLAAAVLLVCVAWLWAVGTVSVVRVVRVVRGADLRRPGRGVPALVHRGVLAACGLALAGSGTPAVAVPVPLHEEPSRAHGDVPAAAPTGRAARPPPSTGTWVVRRGDTLWAIARDTLARAGSAPPDRAVAARVRALHRLNRAAVPDPDLIHPGWRLRLPPARRDLS